jgi:ethanolamine utilization protein EutN
MRYCRVVGPMWAAVKHPAFAGRSLFVVQPLDDAGNASGASFVAIDHAQAGVGDTVLVLTEGNGVRQILQMGDQVPIRSMIVGIVDHVTTTPEPAR